MTASTVRSPATLTGERLGATPHADGSTSFVLWSPGAERVRLVVGDRVVDLDDADEHGYRRARVDGVEAGARYAYLLDDDELELPDPASASQPDGVHGRSEVVDHAAHEWHDSTWRGIPLRDYVIYELHVGSFTPEGTFDAAAARLPQLAADGITAIELLPVAEFPGARNWGYDGVDLFAAHSAYGGPEGLRRFVDAAHAAGVAVVLDVVYNHFGPEGGYVGRFGPYFTDRHMTPWGQAVNVDDAGSDEVRRFFIENALGWLRDFHVDGLRLDAIHGIVDTSATPFLAELADAVAELRDDLNRRAYVIAESDLNDVRVITPREQPGGIGMDSQWSDDLHHALHVAVTGERDGYYADFADEPLRNLAHAYSRGFVYEGQHSRHRGRRHGSAAAGLPGDRFVVYAQNHDQVGNRMLGDRLAARVDVPGQRLLAAAVLLSPFVPMLFMGEEYGETAPFPYFVSHGDDDLVAAVRAGRAREFAAFHDGDAPDPQGEATFRSAQLDWDSRERGAFGEQLDWTRELLRLRRDLPSIRRLRPAEADVRLDEARGTICIERAHAGERTLVVLGFGEMWRANLPGEGWTCLLDSGDAPRGAALFRCETED
ncbi:MAG: maltooligosyl trehalose hydrolase [Thermoleophilia bacterium]|nr:maltooligosyl trehalose hydrolase [Thermoleophilia bacterium]